MAQAGQENLSGLCFFVLISIKQQTKESLDAKIDRKFKQMEAPACVIMKQKIR